MSSACSFPRDVRPCSSSSVESTLSNWAACARRNTKRAPASIVAAVGIAAGIAGCVRGGSRGAAAVAAGCALGTDRVERE